MRVNDPTPDQIKQRCADVRATWTEAEERKRRQIKTESWRPKVVSTEMFDAKTRKQDD